MRFKSKNKSILERFFWVMSRVLLGIVYLLVVLPTGLIRRLLGKDSLNLRLWKQSGDSCFVKRIHIFTANDLKHPY